MTDRLWVRGSLPATAVLLVISAAVLAATTSSPPTSRPSIGNPADSAAVATALERFHRALETGDSSAALGLLAPDLMVLESGATETLAEYREHHLPADLAFAGAVRNARAPVRVTLAGDVAWAVATSRTDGEYRGRKIASDGAELAVLSRSPDGWRIRAIHWSSRPRHSGH
jgi:ketosteroid isomerase-like protein